MQVGACAKHCVAGLQMERGVWGEGGVGWEGEKGGGLTDEGGKQNQRGVVIQSCSLLGKRGEGV